MNVHKETAVHIVVITAFGMGITIYKLKFLYCLRNGIRAKTYRYLQAMFYVHQLIERGGYAKGGMNGQLPYMKELVAADVRIVQTKKF